MTYTYAYLAANLLLLGILLRRGYHRLWQWGASAVLVGCWQIAVSAFVPLVDRSANVRWWMPGEIALLIVSSGAVIESLWMALPPFPRRYRTMIVAGLTVSIFSAVAGLRVLSDDWYDQFLADRKLLWLALAVLAMATLAIGSLRMRDWPRVARMHSAVWAILASSHVLFGDFVSKWRWANSNFRVLEVLCLIGWSVNAGFLVREVEMLVAVAQRSHDAFPQLTAAFAGRQIRAARTYAPSLPDVGAAPLADSRPVHYHV